MGWLRALVERHGVQCDLQRTGTYRAAATRPGRRAIERYRAFLESAGLEFEELDQAALQRRLGTRYYGYGLYSPDCSLVQPAALIRGLADSLPKNVTLYEETPAIALRREGAGWRIECPEGSLYARHVVLANNAFVRGLGIGGGQLSAIYTYAALTRPLPAALLERLGSESGWGLLPAHRLGSTLRRTADGRLMVRSFYGSLSNTSGEAPPVSPTTARRCGVNSARASSSRRAAMAVAWSRAPCSAGCSPVVPWASRCRTWTRCSVGPAGCLRNRCAGSVSR
jgi:glycine/D-amino acid oxidase-like deaminating enzyme